MTVGTLPAAAIQVTAATTAESEQKSSIDRSAYEGLGFTGLDVQNDDNSFFGTANTVLMPKKELYLNYNSSSNYGQLLRSGLNMTVSGGDLKSRGAYQRYGQYKNGKWAKLEDKYGYSYGQLGGKELYRNIKSENKNQKIAYAESVAFNSGDGRDSQVATVYLKTNNSNRSTQKIVLEITSFGSDGKNKSSSSYTVSTCGENSALNEQGYFYPADYTALIDITAGDYDGDGADEIALYGADNKVIIYRWKNGGLSKWKTLSAPDIYTDTGVSKSGDGSSNPSVKRAAIVTLESFDLDKNNADELVITVSAPQDVSNTKYKELNYGYIYGGKNFAQQAKIPLYDDATVLQAANSAAGDFVGNSRNMLVFGGRAAKTSSPTAINLNDKIAVKTVTYNHNTKAYEVGDIQKLNEDFNSTMLANRNLKYNPPIAMIGFNMYGEKDADGNSGERLFLFDRLYKYNGGTLQADGTTINYGSDQRNNANEKADKETTWISGIAKGNFTKKDIGRKEQLVAVVGQKESGSDSYWFQIAYISADNNNNPVRNWEGVINQGNNYYNRTDKSRQGSYLTVCAPDVDHDSLLLKFKGSETYYSKPEVQAIMQSAPYFQDVADVYDDYLNNGVTSYGKSESGSKGVSASIETSLGLYTSEEASLGAAAEFEASVAATASYEHQSSWTTSKEVEYAGGIGDDYVIMYTVPFHRYVYDGTDLNGKTVPFIIEEPMTPVTVIVTVDKYDEIAEMYDGLEKIRGNVLKSTPGNPSSYTTWSKGDFKSIGDVQLLTNAGKGNGSTVTVSQTDEYEQEHSFAVGVEENIKAGGGAGFLGNNVKAGVVQSMSVSAGGVFSNMSGVAYTGTVDNLPEGVTDFGFNWQLGYSQIKFNDEDVIVIGYKTSNVKRPPTAPKNVAITDISRDTMTLEWDESPEAAVYELSFVTADGEELPLANISGTAVENGVVSYDVKNLNPASSYTFRVRASDAYGVRSLASQPITGSTLSDGDDEFSITEQPQDTETAAGRDALFSIRATGTGSEPIRYQWYVYDKEDKAWIKTGSNSSELIISATDDLNGSRYYCTVYQGTKVLKSKSATLTIGLAQSHAELKITNGGKKIDDNDFVKAAYETINTTSQEKKTWRTETAETGGIVYTKLAASEIETTDENGETTYSYTEPFVWSADDGTRYFADKSGSPDIGNEYTVSSSHFVFVNSADSSKTVETANTAETIAAVTINGNQCTSGYKLIGSDAYMYACTVTGADSESSTEYYLANANGSYDKYTFDLQADYINIGGTEYRTDSLVTARKQYSDTVTEENAQHNDGDKILLSAAVSESTRKEISSGKLNFRITNKSTGVTDTVAGTLSADGKNWTAEYEFSASGAYDITAMYMGSNIYKTSISEKITVNAYNPKQKTLFINGGNLTYGNSLALNPIIIETDKRTNADGVTYIIKKYVKTAKGDILEDCQSGLISADVFAPDSTGKYEITALCAGISATATISVSPATVTLTPNNASGNLDEDEAARQNKISVTIDGMTAADASIGTVSAVYADGRNFASGDTLPSGKRITLTAKAADGYVLSGWQKKNGANWEYIKAEGTDKNNTASAITVSGVTSDETYRALFAAKEEKTLTLSVEDFGGNKVASAQVFVNGTQLSENADGKLTYTAYKHEKLDIEVKTPDTVLINYWSVNGASEAGSTGKHTIYDLSDNAQCIIYCTIPNTRQIAFGAVMADGSGVPSSWTHEYIYATRDGSTIAASPSTQPQGVRIEFTAVPADGYRVKEWLVNGSEVGGSANKYVMTVDENADVKAVFEKKPVVTVTYNSAMGTVSADADGSPMGAYVEFGADVVFTIEPMNGYIVKSAALNGAPLSLTVGTANTDKRFCTAYDINSDVTLSVEFAKKPVITTNIGSNGTAELSGTADFAPKAISSGDYVDFDTDLTAAISPNFGFVVDTVTVDGAPIALTAEENSDNMSFKLSAINADKDINITFRALEKTTLNLEVINTEDGAAGAAHGSFAAASGRKGMNAYKSEESDTESCSLDIYEGGTVTINAVADSGYRIREWTVDGTVDANIGKTLTLGFDEIAAFSDKTVKVQFEEGKGRLTFTQPVGGTISASVEEIEFLSGGTPEIGADVEFVLTPNEHFVLKNWLLNGSPISGEDKLTYTFTADENDATVSAELEKEPLTVTAAAEANGTVSGLPSIVRHGDTITLTASPNPGYEFEGWYENGAKIDGADAVYAFTAEKDADFVAKFTEKATKTIYTITVLPSANGKVTATVGDTAVTEVQEGTVVTFTATADENYMLSAWTNDAATETETVFTRTITDNITVGAEFISALYYDVTFGVAAGTSSGTISAKANDTAVTPNITVRHARGSKLVFTAAPDADKMVKEWTVNGEIKKELSNKLEFELLENTNVTVEYEDLVLWKIPADKSGEYTLTDIVREPTDYGSDADRTVRDRGNAQFHIKAADGKTITSFAIADDTADSISIVRNDDASYDVKLAGIKKDVVPEITVSEGIPLTISAGANGSVTVKNGDTVLANNGAVKAGDELTVTAVPNSGYRTRTLTVNGNPVYNGKYTVADTDTAVAVHAEFTTAGGGGGGGGGSSSSGLVIKFDSNGGTEVASIKATKNEAISAPTAPSKDGFEFDGWYTDKELTVKYDFSQKVSKSFTLYAKWNEKNSETPVWNNPFGDVDTDDWFFDAVKYANENSLMSGTAENEFDPNGSVTRAMLVTILWRAEGKPQVNYIMPFEDVPDEEYYAEAVRWAASEGIVKGYSENEFAPNENIIREQIAAIMHRYASYKKYDTSVGENTNILSYSDFSSISEYAIPSVQYAVGSGLIKGKTDSTINPSDNATRAETAEIMRRFIELNK